MVAMGRSLFSLLVDQYFDDSMVVKPVHAGEAAQDCLSFCHRAAGRDLDVGEHQAATRSNPALGVLIDVSRVHSKMCIIVSCSWHRCLSVLISLRDSRDGDFLAPGTVSAIQRKLRFILSSAYGRVGRAASQPLVQRAWYDTDMSFSPVLRHMLAFFEALLPCPPPLSVAVDSSIAPPVVVYTDASFHREADGTPVSHIVYQILDPVEDGSHRVIHCDLALGILTPAALRAFSSDSVALIMQAEIAAATLVHYSQPALFRESRVMHFVDNTGALSPVIFGYARKFDCARMVNSFHLLVAALQMQVFFEWVPSHVNTSIRLTFPRAPSTMALWTSM